MKKIALLLCISSPSFFCEAQDSVTLYYANRHFDQIVDADKAKFSETIIRENGTVTTTQKDLKKNIVIYRHAQKGDEPVGLWVSAIGKRLEERDYDFELKYAKKDCANTGALQEVSNFLQDNAAIQYTAPKLAAEEADIMDSYEGDFVILPMREGMDFRGRWKWCLPLRRKAT